MYVIFMYRLKHINIYHLNMVNINLNYQRPKNRIDHNFTYISYYITTAYGKKCVNKKERERHLPGYCQYTSLESTDHDESR